MLNNNAERTWLAILRQIQRIGAKKGLKGLKGKIASASQMRASSLRFDPIPARLAGNEGILPSWLNHPVHDSFRHSARIAGKALLLLARDLSGFLGSINTLAVIRVCTCAAAACTYDAKQSAPSCYCCCCCCCCRCYRFVTRCPLLWWLLTGKVPDSKNFEMRARVLSE